MTPILVSALYDLAGREGSGRRSIAEYLRLGQLLLESRHPLVLFTDPALVAEVARRRRGGELSVVPLAFEELAHASRVGEIASHLEEGRRGRASTDPVKDTAAYFALMWSKPALVARASELLISGGTMFWWVDFGLAHAAGAHPELTFDDLIAPIDVPIHLTVRWQPSQTEVADRATYYRDTRGAKVGGSLFGAQPARAAWLADRIADEVDRCLAEGWPTTEEVLLGAVLAEHEDECEVHFASPRTTLVNFLGTRSDPFVALDAIRTLSADGRPRRAFAIARELEDASRSGRLHLGELAEVQLYDALLVAAWHAGARDKALDAARTLEQLLAFHGAQTPAGAEIGTARIRTNIELVRADPGLSADAAGTRFGEETS